MVDIVDTCEGCSLCCPGCAWESDPHGDRVPHSCAGGRRDDARRRSGERWDHAIAAALAALLALAFLAGCAGVMPTQTVNGVAVYVRPDDEVTRYCYNRVRPEDRAVADLPGGRIFGCYVPAERTIVVAEGHPEVLAHELRHAAGWNHRGPCHSTREYPDGRKPDGSPCEWYQGR